MPIIYIKRKDHIYLNRTYQHDKHRKVYRKF